jgi:hypothetical protein
MGDSAAAVVVTRRQYGTGGAAGALWPERVRWRCAHALGSPLSMGASQTRSHDGRHSLFEGAHQTFPQHHQAGSGGGGPAAGKSDQASSCVALEGQRQRRPARQQRPQVTEDKGGAVKSVNLERVSSAQLLLFMLPPPSPLLLRLSLRRVKSRMEPNGSSNEGANQRTEAAFSWSVSTRNTLSGCAQCWVVFSITRAVNQMVVFAVGPHFLCLVRRLPARLSPPAPSGRVVRAHFFAPQARPAGPTDGDEAAFHIQKLCYICMCAYIYSRMYIGRGSNYRPSSLSGNCARTLRLAHRPVAPAASVPFYALDSDRAPASSRRGPRAAGRVLRLARDSILNAAGGGTCAAARVLGRQHWRACRCSSCFRHSFGGPSEATPPLDSIASSPIKWRRPTRLARLKFEPQRRATATWRRHCSGSSRSSNSGGTTTTTTTTISLSQVVTSERRCIADATWPGSSRWILRSIIAQNESGR